jgi:hypothetical protein
MNHLNDKSYKKGIKKDKNGKMTKLSKKRTKNKYKNK